ncbi:MAG TPA: ATP-binding cassette domain-containing protein [Longimicrobiales bacterium]|nr:ATP-binding cassette domain-containing protein [Longimicrobiales bacterium]
MTPLLRAEHVTKTFGGVTALDDVSFEAHAGAVTCLLGDNGAGKSTLIRVLSGVYPPTSGRLLLDDVEIRFRSPRDALARGIATVYQDLALVPLMSVWRNFYLGAEPVTGRGPLRRIDVGACRSAVLRELSDLGIPLRDPEQAAATLSGGQQQALAIARAVHRGARLLILDEPTAALGVAQRALVMDLVRRVRDRGVAVVLITHDPAQADALADRRVVLERGRVVDSAGRQALQQ